MAEFTPAAAISKWQAFPGQDHIETIALLEQKKPKQVYPQALRFLLIKAQLLMQDLMGGTHVLKDDKDLSLPDLHRSLHLWTPVSNIR